MVMRVQLLSDSCTTGWLHWGHGELWLTSDSIVRIGKRRLTLASAGRGAMAGFHGGALGGFTRELARAGSVSSAREVERSDWLAYVADHRNVITIDLADVTSARLRAGLSTSRLAVGMRDGRRIKLLWMRNQFALEALVRAGLGSS
jgi:hypothetical protein